MKFSFFNLHSNFRYVWIVIPAVITFLIANVILNTYVRGPLGGEFNYHLMSAKRFGVPEELRKKGLSALYLDLKDSGWDGQFYYYMSNDLLGIKDIPKHVDADAYRYQRIGLPAFSKFISLLFGQDWVSPKFYYGTQLGLILIATILGSLFFFQSKVSPLWILPWSMGIGTQLTLLNGLPDAAADSFLIIALFFIFRRKLCLYSIFILFAALSREIYILIPIFILFYDFLEHFKKKIFSKKMIFNTNILAHIFVLGIFMSWHMYVRIHFDKSPSSQAHGILGLPLKSLFYHLWKGLSGNYPNFPSGIPSFLAGLDILIFLFILVYVVWVLFFKFKDSTIDSLNKNITKGVGASFLCIILLYLCFGDTVVWHFSGFMKAATIMFFIIPIVFTLNKKPISKYLIYISILLTGYFGKRLWDFRLNHPPIQNAKDINCNLPEISQPGNKCKSHFIWLGSKLPGIVGDIIDSKKVASHPKTNEGFLTYGPYLDIPPGNYLITLNFRSQSSSNSYWEVGAFSEEKMVVLCKIDLPLESSNTEVGKSECNITLKEELLKFESRVYYSGKGILEVDKLELIQK